MKKTALIYIFNLLALLLISSCGKTAEEAIELENQNRFSATKVELNPLTVLVEQIATQNDPTNTFPISYSVEFSSNILPETFSEKDIQNLGSADSVQWQIINSGDNRNFILNALSSATDGTIVVNIEEGDVKSIGKSNQKSTSSDNSVTIDRVSPSVVLTHPTGVEWFSNTITVTGTCSEDSDIGLSVNTLSVVATCRNSVFSETLDISSISDGNSISINASPKDLATNIGTSITTSFHKDVTAPVFAGPVDISANNATCTNSPTTTWPEASDLSSGMSHYEFAIGTTTSTQDIANWTNIGSVTSYTPNYSNDFSSHLVLGTDYYTFVRAVDNAGNTSIELVSSVWQFRGFDAVNDLGIAATLTDSIFLSWSPPINNGSSAIDNYTLEYKEASGQWLLYGNTVNAATNMNVLSLAADTTYDFRVVANYCGLSSIASNVVSASTKPNNPIFNSIYKIMNVGGATQSVVVALEDNTKVELNGSALVTLNAGERHIFNSSQFDIIDADRPIYTSGKRGNGTGAKGANIVWQPTAWAGKKFVFNADRQSPQHFKIYAIEDSIVTIVQGTTVLASRTLLAGQSSDETWNEYGSYHVSSTGHILGFHISNDKTNYYIDAKPILPASKEIIGFPSQTMRLASSEDNNNYSYFHSDGSSNSSVMNKSDSHILYPKGSKTTLYQSNSLLIQSDNPVFGASYADSNGYCSSAFLPTSLMKKRFIIPTNADWIAFASKQGGSIDVYDENGIKVETLNLERSSDLINTPYKVRKALPNAGYSFVSTVNVAAWFQPNVTEAAAPEDESILYGFD